jgi:hypothetical protein
MARFVERATLARAALLVTLSLSVVGCVVQPDNSYAPNPYPPVPAARIEVVPQPPRRAMVWQPGHQQWDGREYRWEPGRYLDRPYGTHWVAGQWARSNGRWVWVAAHWQ